MGRDMLEYALEYRWGRQLKAAEYGIPPAIGSGVRPTELQSSKEGGRTEGGCRAGEHLRAVQGCLQVRQGRQPAR